MWPCDKLAHGGHSPLALAPAPGAEGEAVMENERKHPAEGETALVNALSSTSTSTSRESRPAAPVPGGRVLPQARGEALLPALPGPPQPASGRVGQRVAAPHRLHRHPAQGRWHPIRKRREERIKKKTKKRTNNNKKTRPLHTSAVRSWNTFNAAKATSADWFNTFL